MRPFQILPLIFIWSLAVACNPETTASESPEPGGEPAAAPSAKPAPEPPAPAPRRETVTLPEGTPIEIRLMEALSSETNQTGDTFEAQVDADVTADESVVVPGGSPVRGQVKEAAGSGRVKGRARLALVLTSVEIGGRSYPLETEEIAVEAEGTQTRDAVTVGGAAGVGALVGGIIGGKKGAAIGAAVGGGAGTAGVLTTKGKEVEFPVEQAFRFTLRSPLEIEKSR